MIHRVQVNRKAKPPASHPHVQKLAWPPEGDLEFSPGVNIIFGPNGCGKSTLIDIMASWLQCLQGGVQVITETMKQSSNCSVIPIYDGQPVRYISANQRPGMQFGMAGFDHDFMGDNLFGIMHANKMSSGEGTQQYLLPFLQVLSGKATIPALTAKGGGEAASSWQAQTLQSKDPAAWNFVQGDSALGQGPPTLLMDEGERALDLVWQVLFWQKVRNHILAQTQPLQLIIATHSPWALDIPGANYIIPNPLFHEAALEACNLLPQSPCPVDSINRYLRAGRAQP